MWEFLLVFFAALVQATSLKQSRDLAKHPFGRSKLCLPEPQTELRELNVWVYQEPNVLPGVKMQSPHRRVQLHNTQFSFQVYCNSPAEEIHLLPFPKLKRNHSNFIVQIQIQAIRFQPWIHFCVYLNFFQSVPKFSLGSPTSSHNIKTCTSSSLLTAMRQHVMWPTPSEKRSDEREKNTSVLSSHILFFLLAARVWLRCTDTDTHENMMISAVRLFAQALFMAFRCLHGLHCWTLDTLAPGFSFLLSSPDQSFSEMCWPDAVSTARHRFASYIHLLFCF